MKVAYFNRFDLLIPDDAVPACSHPGPCDNDVALWRKRVDFSNISNDELRDELREYGAWDADELADREENECRILWIACGNIAEEEHTARR